MEKVEKEALSVGAGGKNWQWVECRAAGRLGWG